MTTQKPLIISSSIRTRWKTESLQRRPDLNKGMLTERGLKSIELIRKKRKRGISTMMRTKSKMQIMMKEGLDLT